MDVMMAYNYRIFKNTLYQRNELVDIRHNEKKEKKKTLTVLRSELSITALLILIICESLFLSVISLRHPKSFMNIANLSCFP